MNTIDTSESHALSLDAADSLAVFRERFLLPPGKIYLNGNSLGAASKDSLASVQRVIAEWRRLGIGGWMGGDPPWISFAEKVGAMAAELVGARADEVVATGTTTLNIHSLVSTFFQQQPRRRKILADELTFPTALYALQGQVRMKGLDPGEHLLLARSADGRTLDEDGIAALMGEDVAVALLPSVLYRSAQLLDMGYLTRAAHKKGIVIGFDCVHSVGAVPHDFTAMDPDFAVWCSYKHLNAGPGSTAFLYLNRRHFDEPPLLCGWFGYEKERQFDLETDFSHQRSAGGWQVSSPSILAIAAAEGALKIVLEAGIERIRAKSLGLTSYLIGLVDALLADPPYSFRVASPREPERRGGHIALERDEEAMRVSEALKGMGVVVDFRGPATIRIAPAPLYNTYHEVWRVVRCLKEIIDRGLYEGQARSRKAVP
ncbi:MAG: kynureninase [Candidatus Aminicenantes bacterium]|nr:kynureninase [Candidatus Aminicenantes bacterium]